MHLLRSALARTPNLHFLTIPAPGVPSPPFRIIQSEIGRLVEFILCLSVLWKDRRAYTHAGQDFCAPEVHGSVEEIDNAVANPCDTRLIMVSGKKNCKLISAHSRDAVRSPDSNGEAFRCLDKEGVAGVVTIRIIDPFEPVEVNQ